MTKCLHFLGRVCIPIDPAKAESFDPETVPTISQLTAEIDKFAQEEKEHQSQNLLVILAL